MRLLQGQDTVLLAELHEAAKKGGKGSGWSSIIGIVTAIVGNILISFALNTQRYAHVRLEAEYNEKRAESPPGKRQTNDPQNYGAAQQERIADERSKANATAPGPGGSNQEDDSPSSPDHMQDSFQSDDTIKPGDHGEEDEGRKSYLKSKIWWIGIIMMTIGETGNFLAYGFAPASIVSPLGVVALISNCLIAPLVLKEPFRQRDFWGVVIAILGAVTVVLSANQNEAKLNPDVLWNYYIKRWEFLAYVIVTIVAVVGLTIASPKYGQRTIAVDLGLVGLYGGYTAISTKGVAALLSSSLYKAFTFPIFYVLVLVLVASAIMQIRYLNKALQNFNSTQVIPTQFVCFTLSVIIGSAVLYREFESETADHAIKFVAGCLLTFFGVYLITSKHQRHDDDEKDDYEEDVGEAIHLIDEDGQEATERTPLRLETSHKLPKAHNERFLTPGQPLMDTPFPVTPPRSPTHSNVPSIAVTPAAETPQMNPWNSSDSVLPPPRTPISRHASETEATPFFTPSTSQRPTARTVDSSPADPETPTRKQRGPSPPKPDSAAIAAAAQNGFIRRSTRDSIQRFIPGPLLAPLASSSLSGIVADSLRRGEGSPISVRQRLRRSRTSRAFNDRRRSVQPGDEESGLLSRQRTHDGLGSRSKFLAGTQSAEDVADVVGGEGSMTQKKSRLRSMSETLGSLMKGDSKRGKRREDERGGS